MTYDNLSTIGLSFSTLYQYQVSVYVKEFYQVSASKFYINYAVEFLLFHVNKSSVDWQHFFDNMHWPELRQSSWLRVVICQKSWILIGYHSLTSCPMFIPKRPECLKKFSSRYGIGKRICNGSRILKYNRENRNGKSHSEIFSYEILVNEQHHIFHRSE